MKLNLEEQEETIEPVEKTDLIYGIDDRPPFKEALFAALQIGRASCRERV